MLYENFVLFWGPRISTSFGFEALESTKISSYEPVSSRKYENGRKCVTLQYPQNIFLFVPMTLAGQVYKMYLVIESLKSVVTPSVFWFVTCNLFLTKKGKWRQQKGKTSSFCDLQALEKLNEDLVDQLRVRNQVWDEERTLYGDIFVTRVRKREFRTYKGSFLNWAGL